VLHGCAPERAPGAALDVFEQLLDEWGIVVAGPGDFHWMTERAPDEVEYLVSALFEAGLAIEALHEDGLAELRPGDADEFHFALVNQVLAALDREGGSSAQFVEILRTVWGVAGGA